MTFEGTQLGSPVTVLAIVQGERREYRGSAFPDIPIEIDSPDLHTPVEVELSDTGSYFAGSAPYQGKPGRIELFVVGGGKLTGPVDWDLPQLMTVQREIIFEDWKLYSGSLPARTWDLSFYLVVNGIRRSTPFHQQEIYTFATSSVRPASAPQEARADEGDEYSIYAEMTRPGHLIEFESDPGGAPHLVGPRIRHVLHEQ